MRRSTWIAVGLVLVVAASAAVAFGAVVRRIDEKASVSRSRDNMMSFATMLLDERGQRPPVGGKRLALWLAVERIDRSNPRNLEILFSPGDRELSLEKVGAGVYADLTQASLLDPATDVRRLTSYAGRRIGAADPPGGRVPLFADLSFRDRGFVLVVYSDRGSATLTREDLGLGPDDPIVVGDESKSPTLRALSDE